MRERETATERMSEKENRREWVKESMESKGEEGKK